MDAELPNSLPGDDKDECLLLPGELCQHLCINTVGSYRCACFPGFSLQDDGRTCRPGRGPDGWAADLGSTVWCFCDGDYKLFPPLPPHMLEPAGTGGPLVMEFVSLGRWAPSWAHLHGQPHHPSCVPSTGPAVVRP